MTKLLHGLISTFLSKWGLNQAQAAKVLRINESKMSEYCRGERPLPPYVESHIETFNHLSERSGNMLIKKRLNSSQKKPKK